MQSAEDFAGVIKIGSILVPAAFTPMAFITGHYLKGSVLVLASFYAIWHERQARKARERLLESDNQYFYFWRASALLSGEPANDDVLGIDVPALQESDHIPSEDQKALDIFTRSLQDAAGRAVTTPKDRGYSSVHVLLLYWDEDYSIINTDLESLRDVLADGYGYGVKSFAIPSENAAIAIHRRVAEFVYYNDDPENLIIMYYCGDMILHDSREGWWAPRRSHAHSTPVVGLESLLSQSKSDILLLFDSCYPSAALAASVRSTTSVMQLIAAASFEGHIHQEDRSFTKLLTDILSSSLSSNTPISVSEVHVRILTRMKLLASRGRFHRRNTPFHFTIQQQDAPKDILLAPLKPCPASPIIESDASVQEASQVLLSIRIQEPLQGINNWRQWLSAMPEGKRQEVRVEGVFESG